VGWIELGWISLVWIRLVLAREVALSIIDRQFETEAEVVLVRRRRCLPVERVGPAVKKLRCCARPRASYLPTGAGDPAG